MATKPLPSPEVLRQLFQYDPETGDLFWKQRDQEYFKSRHGWMRWNTRYSGKLCGGKLWQGYRTVAINRSNYQQHRVIFSMWHNQEFIDLIDHIDGNRSNNRISNLREVSPLENRLNTGLSASNRIGAYGIRHLTASNRWRATIKVNGKSISLGCYEHLSDAIRARKDAERLYGFHENYGMRLAVPEAARRATNG